MARRFCILLAPASWLLLLSFANTASAHDWPQWRGPQRTGISTETGLLKQWPADGPPLAWHVDGLGDAYASVVVQDGRIYTIGKQGSTVFAFSIAEADGMLLWKKEIGTTGRNVMSTPTLDQDRVYVVDPDGQLVCLSTADGTIRWKRDYAADFDGKLQSGRGYGESPLVDGDRLICTPGGPEAMIVALDKLTGETIWKTAIPELGTAGADGACFSSIIISRGAGIRQYVQMVGRGLIGIASDDGRFLWGYNDIANGTANIPTPSVRDDLVFASNGYNSGSVLLKLAPDGKRGVTAAEVYRLNGSQLQNHHGGSIVVGEHVFAGHGSNNGLPTCLELATGRLKWKRRGPGIGSASIVYADGHIYFHYQNGVIGLVEASSAGYKLKGSFQLPGAGADSWAHPVVANGQLLLREKDKLWSYNVRQDAAVAVAPMPSPLPVEPEPALRKLVQHGATLRAMPAGTKRLISNTAADTPLVVGLTDKHLTEEGAIRPKTLTVLATVEQPCILYIGGTRITAAGLKQVASFPAIIGLNLEFCRSLSDDSLAAIQDAAHLRLLDLSGTRITNTGLLHLLQLQKLTFLSLEVCDDVTDDGCSTLARMTQLRGLILKKTGFEPASITNIGFQQLAALTNLEVLNLYGNRINDEGMSAIESLTKMRQLNLSLLGITDQALLNLKPLAQLEELELLYSEGFGGTNLGDAGMTTLASLSQLQSINLIGAKITDSGFSKLTALKSLRRLSIAGTGVTSTAVDKLKAVLPECRVIR